MLKIFAEKSRTLGVKWTKIFAELNSVHSFNRSVNGWDTLSDLLDGSKLLNCSEGKYDQVDDGAKEAVPTGFSMLPV